jgi:hypothetical protein
MIAPRHLSLETIYANADWRPAMEYLERDGVTPADLSVAGVVARCSLSKVDDDTTCDRASDAVGETAWVDDGDGTDGRVDFIYKAVDLADILTAEGEGEYDGEYFREQASASILRMVAKGRVRLVAGVT